VDRIRNAGRGLAVGSVVGRKEVSIVGEAGGRRRNAGLGWTDGGGRRGRGVRAYL
jgi:hypothetical protein